MRSKRCRLARARLAVLCSTTDSDVGAQERKFWALQELFDLVYDMAVGAKHYVSAVVVVA